MGETRNATTSRSGSRFYTWGRGERYWSVTTILKALPKDALKFWAAKMVAEFAFDRTATWLTMERPEAVEWLKKEPLRYTADRANFGSAVHAAAEAYVLKKPLRMDFREEEQQAVGQFLDFLETLEVRFLLVEASVFNRTQKYAGTTDGVIVVPHAALVALAKGNAAVVPWEPDEAGNVTLLIDYKTGGQWEGRKGVYPDVALQLAAYARAEFVGMPNGTETPLPRIDGCAVIHIRPEGWRLVPVDALNEDVFRSFLYVREVFRWLDVTSKEVLGFALEPDRDAIDPDLRAPDQIPEKPKPEGSALARARASAGTAPAAPPATSSTRKPKRRRSID